MARRFAEVAAVVFGGSVSGLVAGAVMLLVAMLHSDASQMGFWLPVRQVAALWYGVDALVGGESVLLVGLVTHLVVAMGWGLVFAALTSRRSGAVASLVSGLAFGTVLWAVMTFVVLPIVNPVMYERIRMAHAAWFAYHLIYGGLLFATPALERLVVGLRPGAAAPSPTAPAQAGAAERGSGGALDPARRGSEQGPTG